MKKNDCTKCPYYYSHYDSFTCDGEEYCECGMNDPFGEVKGCNHPLFIRRFLAFKEKIKEYILDIRIKKAWEKEEKTWIEMGMTEEEYFNYKCDLYEKENNTI